MDKFNGLPDYWLCACGRVASVLRPQVMVSNRGYVVPVPYCLTCGTSRLDERIVRLVVDLRLGETHDPKHDGTKPAIINELLDQVTLIMKEHGIGPPEFRSHPFRLVFV